MMVGKPQLPPDLYIWNINIDLFASKTLVAIENASERELFLDEKRSHWSFRFHQKKFLEQLWTQWSMSFEKSWLDYNFDHSTTIAETFYRSSKYIPHILEYFNSDKF